jgi:hypothetical protein
MDIQSPSLDQAPQPFQGDALAVVFVTAFRALPEATRQAIWEQLLREEISDAMACALASEATLAKYWDTPEEDAAWAYLSGSLAALESLQPPPSRHTGPGTSRRFHL